MEFRKEKNVVGVIMKDGEDLLENLRSIAKKFRDTPLMVVISALGMVSDVKLGYWDGKEYITHDAPESCELLGVSGILTPKTDPPYHFHLIIGKKDGSVMGGHFMGAKVSNTLEMFLLEVNIPVERYLDGKLKKLRFTV